MARALGFASIETSEIPEGRARRAADRISEEGAALLARVPADAATMNRLLQTYIDQMPDQYYWVHKRFKVRPPGEPSVY